MPDYDAAFKRICEDPEVVHSYIKYAGVPQPIFDSLDFATLRQVTASLVSDTLIQRHGDMIWQVDCRRGGPSLYVVFHIEFQSQNNPSMALRMLTYAAMIYESLWNSRKHRQEAVGGKLPTVISTVLYTGAGRWSAPLEVSEFLDEAHRELQPSFRYLLIEERELARSGEAQAQDMAGALMLSRHSMDYGMIKQAQQRIIASESYGLHRRAYDELAQDVGARKLGKEVATVAHLVSEIEELEENARLRWTEVGRQQGREQGIEQGREQGIEQGREQGIEQGREQVAKHMLSKGWSMRDIQDCTGLTIEQIRALQNGA